ncbi:hypothetical protein CPB85DRAFT_1329450, partial [Mucidula mucida]
MIRSSSSLSVDATCRKRSPLSARGRCVPGSCLSSGGKLSQRPASDPPYRRSLRPRTALFDHKI